MFRKRWVLHLAPHLWQFKLYNQLLDAFVIEIIRFMIDEMEYMYMVYLPMYVPHRTPCGLTRRRLYFRITVSDRRYASIIENNSLQNYCVLQRNHQMMNLWERTAYTLTRFTSLASGMSNKRLQSSSQLLLNSRRPFIQWTVYWDLLVVLLSGQSKRAGRGGALVLLTTTHPNLP